jgi:hypothetical protein
MNGCNKPYNGEHKVEGSSLRCGNKLLWKTADNNRERTLEIILCEDCKQQDTNKMLGLLQEDEELQSLVDDTTEEGAL